MKKTTPVIICVLMISLRLHAQMASFSTDAPVLTPPSPTAASLALFADYPVSHYTGIPNISIPIYEIDIDGYTLPIALNYHSSGMRVSQEASWVGLGWALSTGGAISRTVKCIDDFAENGGFGCIGKGFYTGPEISDLNAHFNIQFDNVQLLVDSEPDVFYLNLPNASAKFIIDKSRGPVLLEKTLNIKITVAKSPYVAGYYFTATTPDGIQYIFDKKEISENHTKPGILQGEYDDNNINNYVECQSYTSTWYLGKIILPNKREITFTYAAEKYSAPAQESCVKYNLLGYGGTYNCNPPPSHTYPVYSRSKQIISALRLSRVAWDNGYIDFISSKRLDIKGNYDDDGIQKLDRIKVYGYTEGLIKCFDFSYGYFDNSQNSGKDYLYKRLRLDIVREAGVGNYTLLYYDGNFPAKNSSSTDYWGYYNGKNYEAQYYSRQTYESKVYPGAIKTADIRYLMTGMLTQINFPTGGYNKFYYEENTFNNNVLFGLAGYQVNKGGGLRILQIESGGTNTTPKYRNFKYSGGKAIIPQCVSYVSEYICKSTDGSSGFRRYFVQTSSSTVPLTSLRNGNIVGYSNVEEWMTDGRNTQIVRYCYHNDVENESGIPFVSTYINYYNGLPEEITYLYKDNKTKKMYQTRKVLYEYTSVLSNVVKAFYFKSRIPEPFFYNYEIEWVKKTYESTLTSLSPEGVLHLSESTGVVEKKYFSYNPINWQVSSVHTYCHGKTHIEKTYFPQDFIDAVSQGMVNRHMINTSVESVLANGSNVVAGKKVVYKYESESGMYLPGIIYKLSVPATLTFQNYKNYFVPKVYFDEYNSKGKSVQVRTDESSTVYLWGYKNKYPIAEVKNATFSQITSIITKLRLQEIANRDEPTGEDWILINSLRTDSRLKNSFVSTFKYKALTGISEVTDSNGLVVYYDYDSYGRLKEIYFKENGFKRILEYNEYKHADQ